MTEHDKHMHEADAAEVVHEHAIGHLDNGEPITDSDINYGALWFIAIVGCLLTVTIVYVVVGLYGRSISHEQFVKRIGKSYEIKWQQFEDLRSSQRAQLGEESGWTNPDKGLVSIPMSDAVKTTLLEEQQKQAAGLQAETATPATPPVATESNSETSEGASAEVSPAESAADPAAQTDETAEKEGK